MDGAEHERQSLTEPHPLALHLVVTQITAPRGFDTLDIGRHCEPLRPNGALDA